MFGLLKPDTIRISDLLKKVASAEYVLPRFQRNFVWSLNQVVDLLNSIYEQIPIGVFLLWDSDELGAAFKYIGDINPNNAGVRRHAKYVLDGQQRLTSLLFSMKPKDISFPESIKEKYEIKFSITDEKFYAKCPKNHNCVDANFLGSDNSFMNFYVEMSKKSGRENKIQEILEKLNQFRNYEIPILMFTEEVNLDTVSKTFQYLNAKGTPLSLINLIAAKTYSPAAFDLYEHIDNTKKNLLDSGFQSEDFTGEDIIRSIAVFNGIDIHPKSIIENLKTAHLVKDYKKAEGAYTEALIFITDDISVPLKLLPFNTMLIPLTTFFMRKSREDLSPSQVEFVKKWFWRASLNNRYGSEASTTGVLDANILIKSPDLKNINGLNRPLFTIDDIIEAASGSALGKAILGLMQSQRPLDLYSNIDLRMKGVQKRKKPIKNIDKHHIFPRDYLKGKLKGNNRLLADSVCNLAWVSKNTNLLVSNAAPSRYFKKIQEINKDFVSSAEQQFIPVSKNSAIWDNKYKKFLKQRAELLHKEALKRCNF